jgi:hypothetical protein
MSNNGNVTAVKVKLKDGDVFNSALDENGKKLGEEMNGEWAEIIGDSSIIGDETWLEVKSFMKVEESS